MKQINLRRLVYRIRRDYLTTNNLVVVIGILVAMSWAWGSVRAMERNYALQKEVDLKRRQLQLAQLEAKKLEYEQNYFRSDEYKELAAREKLGLVNPGEKVLRLPPNSKKAEHADNSTQRAVPTAVRQSNLQQWVNFLFGGSFRSSQD